MKNIIEKLVLLGLTLDTILATLIATKSNDSAIFFLAGSLAFITIVYTISITPNKQ